MARAFGRILAVGVPAVIILASVTALGFAGLDATAGPAPHGASDTTVADDLTSDAGTPIPGGVAVLTFEGALDAAGAARLERALDDVDVPATVFLTGSSIVHDPGVASGLVSQGDEVGLAGYSQADLSTVAPVQREFELAAAQSALVAATGQVASLVRPFGGGTAAEGDVVHAGAGELADYVVVPTGDGGVSPTASAADLVSDALAGEGGGSGEAGDGTIVSLPVSPELIDRTLQALPEIVAGLQARGQHFETVSGALGGSAQASLSPAGEAQVAVSTAETTAMRSSIGFADVITAMLPVLGLLTVLQVVVMAALAVVQARRRGRPRRRSPHGVYRGPVSVIVPAYNEEANLAATLDSILASRYPDFEVVVVDDGSTDATPRIAASYGDRITSIRQANAGKAAALNHGIASAKHDVIVMIDGDTVFEPDSLAQLVAPMADPRMGAVAGNTKVANRSGFLGRWQHLEYVIGLNLDRRAFDLLGGIATVPGAIGAFRRRAVESVGGVPTRTLAEDTDLTIALNLAGWKVTYAPRAIAWTEAPSTLRVLARQRFRWSFGTMQAMWVHARRDASAGTGVAAAPDPAARRVRRITLPYLLVFQVILPLLSPLVDLYLIYALVFLHSDSVLVVWAAFTALQLTAAVIAFRLDGEHLRDLWALPLMMLVYRQLLYITVIRSVVTLIAGAATKWHPMPRVGAAAARRSGQLRAA